MLKIYKYQSNSETARSVASMSHQFLAEKLSSLEESDGKIVLLLEQYKDDADLIEDFIRSIENERFLSNVQIIRAENVLFKCLTGICRHRVPPTFIRATMLAVK